ncbi:MAG: HAMP domain-containing histidine kinase [Verrucomicrobiales bacterium]|nr:HAMP domain-containing histidine kinase [Verrucomicrobiales bacterium]
MTRPLPIRLLFAACLLVLLAAMAAVSVTTLRLDRAQMQAAQQAETEEKVRLALWRMDSLLTSIMVEESARPFSAWESFARNEPALTKGYAPIQPGEILTPSPLLAYASSNVLLHFQLTPEGQLTSPQVPLDAERTPALMNGATTAGLQTAAARLNEYQSLLNLQCVAPPPDLALSPARAGGLVLNRDLLINGCAVFRTNTVGPVTVPEQLLPPMGPPRGQRVFGGQQARSSQQLQELRSDNEWQARASFNQAVQLQAVTNAYYGNQMPVRAGSQRSSFANSLSSISPLPQTNASAAPNVAARPPAALPVSDIAGEGVFKPLWVGSELVLARRVNFADRFVVQGVWLNWPNLCQSLVVSVKDLFPSAEILPVLAMNTDPQARLLASIPARLVTGPALPAELPNWSPVRTALVVAWLCVLLAALAVALLLHGTVSLSERRAAFVSAVTHELRTPLTTFKMYSEMLAEGMVPDETKRQSYLSTLCSEANRLGHLVENVLAYARLERGSARGRVERVSLGQLIDRVKPRLDQRAAQAEMQVAVDSEDKALDTVVNVDASAVEQILFNLVDNACKYAAPTASEKLIHLEALPEGKFAMLRVRDHGPGISAEGARRLFQPFSKSAHEAAHTAPGVGLGLALCRRLSRSMGGDLRLESLARSGACFVLTLPLSHGGEPGAAASIG